MILLKHNIAYSRRKLHQGAAQTRIQERNMATEAQSQRAAMWQEKSLRQNRARGEREWQEHMDHDQLRLQNVRTEQEVATRERIADNRLRADRAQARQREIQQLQELRRTEMIRDMEERLLEAQERNEDKLMHRSWSEGVKGTAEGPRAQVKLRKIAIENEKQQRRERELEENDDRRQAGRDYAMGALQTSQNDLMKHNEDRFLRQRDNVAAQLQVEKPWQFRQAVEAKDQLAAMRLQKHDLSVQAWTEQHAFARERSAAEAKARKEELDTVKYQQTVDDWCDEDERRQDAVDRRLIALDEAALRANRWHTEPSNRRRLALEDEKREATIQAHVEMEEAASLCEEWGWTVERSQRSLDTSRSLMALHTARSSDSPRNLMRAKSEQFFQPSLEHTLPVPLADRDEF